MKRMPRFWLTSVAMVGLIAAFLMVETVERPLSRR